MIGGAFVTGTTHAERATTQINIAAMQPGTAPRNFGFALTGEGAVSAGRVVADPTAAAQKAIAQTSTDRTDYRFPLAVYEPLSTANVEVSVRLKPIAGKVDQAGGIAVRLATADDYYVVRANALEDNVRFYRVVNGRRQQIKGVDTAVAANQWHTLGLRADGDRFTVWFDGNALFTAEDKTFADPGNVALWTKSDSVTHFDTISMLTMSLGSNEKRTPGSSWGNF
jgi:hypothetical protein